MILAAFETSTLRGSVALSWPGGGSEESLPPGAPHSETLLPALARLLEGAGKGPGDVGALAVGVGPGAFTGLRVGLATAQGWARAAGIPLVPVPSLDALALPHVAEGEVALLAPSALRGWWEGMGAPPAKVVGNGLLAAATALGGVEGLDFQPDGEVPRASAVARLGVTLLAAGRSVPPAGLVPLYVRAPDAILPGAPPAPRG